MVRARGWMSLMAVAVAAGAIVIGASGPAAAGGACHEPASTSSGVAVSLSGLCFRPTVIHVRPGETVTWTNEDDVPHSVTGLGGSWGGFGELAKGEQVTYRFAEAGVFPYACLLHPGMVGAVVAGSATAGGGGLPNLVPARSEPSPEAAVRLDPSGAETGPWKVTALLLIGLLLGIGASAAVRRRRHAA